MISHDRSRSRLQSSLLLAALIALFCSLSTVSIEAQLISVGAKAGVPALDAFKIATSGPGTTYESHFRRYTVGPMIEVGVPFGFAIEFDALYRRIGYSSAADGAGLVSYARTSGNSWEFPLIVKHKFGPRFFRLYAGGGATFNHLSDLKTLGQSFDAVLNRFTLINLLVPSELRRSNNYGAVTVFGVQVGAGRVRVSPEIRYTRWGRRTFSDLNGLFDSEKNQFDFLIGLTYVR